MWATNKPPRPRKLMTSALPATRLRSTRRTLIRGEASTGEAETVRSVEVADAQSSPGDRRAGTHADSRIDEPQNGLFPGVVGLRAATTIATEVVIPVVTMSSGRPIGSEGERPDADQHRQTPRMEGSDQQIHQTESEAHESRGDPASARR